MNSEATGGPGDMEAALSASNVIRAPHGFSWFIENQLLNYFYDGVPVSVLAAQNKTHPSVIRAMLKRRLPRDFPGRVLLWR